MQGLDEAVSGEESWLIFERVDCVMYYYSCVVDSNITCETILYSYTSN